MTQAHPYISQRKGLVDFGPHLTKFTLFRMVGLMRVVKEFVICSVCKKVMRYDSTKGITNLNSHSEACKAPRNTLKSYVCRENIIQNEHRKELCFQAVATSVKDMRPFCLTEGSGMLNLIHCAWNMGARVGIVSKEELARSLPCPTTLSRNVDRWAKLSKDELKMKLQSEIEIGTTFAMTADIWQDKHKRISYFCITLHYFDRNKMKLQDFVLTMLPLDVKRKKDNVYLREIIDSKLIEYGLAEYKANLVFITDRGGNIRVALNNYTRLNCFPHFCHNIVKYGCEVDSIKKLIIVKYFKFNGLNNALEKSLRSAISTRFNYVFNMLGSIDQEWNAIEEILIQRNELHRLNAIDREFIKEMITFLSSFNDASKLTESTYKETLSHVWIGITQICSMCRVQQNDPHYIKAIKARSLEYVESKFVLHQYHRIATFLHPNFKALIFTSSEQKIKTTRDTKNLLNEVFATPQLSSTSPSSNSSSRRSSSSSSSSFLSNYYGQCDDQINEVDSYVNLRWIPDEKIDLFNWWIERKSMFPNLFKLALKIHSIPASSMQSERTFSKSGFIVNNRRSRLNPNTVENLVLLNKNFDFEVCLKHFFK